MNINNISFIYLQRIPLHSCTLSTWKYRIFVREQKYNLLSQTIRLLSLYNLTWSFQKRTVRFWGIKNLSMMMHKSIDIPRNFIIAFLNKILMDAKLLRKLREKTFSICFNTAVWILSLIKMVWRPSKNAEKSIFYECCKCFKLAKIPSLAQSSDERISSYIFYRTI